MATRTIDAAAFENSVGIRLVLRLLETPSKFEPFRVQMQRTDPGGGKSTGWLAVCKVEANAREAFDFNVERAKEKGWTPAPVYQGRGTKILPDIPEADVAPSPAAVRRKRSA